MWDLKTVNSKDKLSCLMGKRIKAWFCFSGENEEHKLSVLFTSRWGLF